MERSGVLPGGSAVGCLGAAPVTVVALLLALGCAAPESTVPVSGKTSVPDVRPVTDGPDRFGFGRAATHEEVAAWNIDVMADGTGLPAGAGTVMSGEPIYAQQCAACHGTAGEGGTAAPLVGYDHESTPPFGPRYEEWRGNGDDVPFTVGNYWPYATTLYDYIYRAMPSSAPGSLEPNEVYALVAWILAKNGIIADDAVVNATTLPAVEMPARDIFVPHSSR